jgi:hypothetical protein
MRALNAGRNDNSVNNFSWDNKALGKEKNLRFMTRWRAWEKYLIP